MDNGANFHVTKWAFQDDEADVQCCIRRWFRFENQLDSKTVWMKKFDSSIKALIVSIYLVRQLPVTALSWVFLIIVDSCFYNPLVVKCSKAACLIVQLMYKFIRSVRFQLQIY